MARSYKDLLVWQKAKILTSALYETTEHFPKTEIFGLTSQIRRAGVSVASNIAEGQGRLTTGEFMHFLGQARGSLLELETQLEIACDLKYLSRGELVALQQKSYQVLGLINRLLASLKVRNKSKVPLGVSRSESLKP